MRVETGGLRNEKHLTERQVSSVREYAKSLGMDKRIDVLEIKNDANMGHIAGCWASE